MDQATNNMNALTNISRIQVRPETLILLLGLYESKGKTFYYNDLFKRDKESLLQRTLEEDIYEIAQILKLDVTDSRVRLISKREVVPKNKEEQLLINFKNVINKIHKGYKHFELLANETQELSKIISKNYESVTWSKKQVTEREGLLATKKTYSARDDLEKLIEIYYEIKRDKKYEFTTVITNFYVDFINLQIFDKLNNEIALILLYALLFQHFPIFNYVSFFKHYNKYSEPLSYALNQANYNWASSFSQTDNLNEIIYQILVASYKEVDEYAHEYDFFKDLNKTDSLENTILKFTKQFTKEELRIEHPNISDSTINQTLKRLREEQKIMSLGTGRSAKWQVIIDNTNYTHLSIFDDE